MTWPGSPAAPENLVSHHLRTLRAAGLASSRREHKIVFYALTELGTRLLDAHLTPTRSRPMSTTPLELPIARSTQVAQQRLDPARARPADPPRQGAVLAITGLHDRRGRDRNHRRDPRRLGRAARLRPGLRDRSARIGHRHLALHRLAPTLTTTPNDAPSASSRSASSCSPPTSRKTRSAP